MKYLPKDDDLHEMALCRTTPEIYRKVILMLMIERASMGRVRDALNMSNACVEDIILRIRALRLKVTKNGLTRNEPEYS